MDGAIKNLLTFYVLYSLILISVITSACNRKEFLKNAVGSVYTQLLDKGLYEVVAVKNFKDKDVDDYIAKLGCKNIIHDTPSYGERVSVGIEESSVRFWHL